jgi:hypothetical protein
VGAVAGDIKVRILSWAASRGGRGDGSRSW